MEDEEGYMALSPRPWNETSTCSQVQWTEGVTKWPKKSKICVGVLGVICGLLGLALIGLMVIQGLFLNKETVVDPNGTKNGTSILPHPGKKEGRACTEDIITHLCEPFMGNSTCKLCPTNWISLKERCYWVSKDKKDWIWARNDCIKKRAKMLVLLASEETEFIQSITEENYPVWIGRNSTARDKNGTKLDRSVLDQNLVSQHLPTSEMSCGVVKGKQVRFEMCSAEFRWICEKEVILF